MAHLPEFFVLSPNLDIQGAIMFWGILRNNEGEIEMQLREIIQRLELARVEVFKNDTEYSKFRIDCGKVDYSFGGIGYNLFKLEEVENRTIKKMIIYCDELRIELEEEE